jgi:hypothetical protein
MDAAQTPTPQAPDADASSCNVVVTQETVIPGSHVPEGTPITYTSNPPSSGPHYPVWANFQEFDRPVPDGYLVHSMEHGAVVLSYKCAECPLIAGGLRDVRDATPSDPACDPSLRVRVIVVPRPELDAAVAAAAWGFTYRADCVEATSLSAFVREHYAHAPEDFCSPGMTTF